MYKTTIFILFILNGDVICTESVANSWIQFVKALTDSRNNCSVDLGFIECLKHSSLQVFDNIVKSDFIPVTDAIRLERYGHRRKTSFDKDVSIQYKEMKRTDISTEPYAEHVLRKLFSLLHTHTLNIDMIPRFVGRARHRNRNQMLPMMAFGATAVGLIMAPMGFQFLAVLAGKALLLSKMALLLASINGLKKVASSGIHYGLYHTNSHHHGQQYWDRGDQDRPRSQI